MVAAVHEISLCISSGNLAQRAGNGVQQRLPGPACGYQQRSTLGLKRCRINRTVPHQRCVHPCCPHRCPERRGGWRSAWHAADCPCSTRCPCITWWPGEIAAGLVHHHERRCRLVCDAFTKRLALLLVARGSAQALFLRVQPRRRIARPRVHGRNVVPWVALHSSACWAQVASGWASRCARSMAYGAGEIVVTRAVGVPGTNVWP
jgi:hypothetical protein